VSPRAERWLEAASSLVLGTLAVGWLWTIVDVRAAGATTLDAREPGVTPTTRAVTAALTSADAPSAAYLTDAALAALTPLRGASGRVRVVLRSPGESLPSTLPPGASIAYTGPDTVTAPDDADSSGASAGALAADAPGIARLAVRVGSAVREVADLSVITLTPLTERRGGRIGLYYIGRWPTEGKGRAPARGDYTPPRGLIEVTPETQDTRVSEHFRLRDFLTKGQRDVWPKYVVVQPRLVDKLELVLADLAARGIPARGVFVMSGFRTPQYNAGGGDPRGRADLSRHMYGDAADIWIDNDGDGRMDDLNGDGRVTVRDAEVIRAAVDRVEREHPELVGGCGVYTGGSGHGPFTHIDARGYRARWTGTGNG
jgi:hypothetical protein